MEENKKAVNLNLVILIFLFLSLGVDLFLIYQGMQLKNQLAQISKQQAEASATPKCSSTTITGYDVATMVVSVNSKGVATSEPAQFSADLKGDGSTQTVILYSETPSGPGGRSKPVITKIFSGSANCLTEEFSYTGVEAKRSGNELHLAQTFQNFWGDGRNIVDVENESTGYGSGSTYYLNFITYKDGKYQVVEGPTVGSDLKYSFRGTNGVGNQILVASPIWAGTEAHFDPHIVKFDNFIWDGQKYNDVTLGTTKRKYDMFTTTLDQIIKAEPSVLLSENAITSTTVQMVPQNNTGESGTAVITAMGNNQASVTLKIDNVPGGQPANIYSGTCVAPGEVKFKLSDVKTGLQTNLAPGTSNTVLNVPVQSLITSPTLIVGVRYAGSFENPFFASCAEIK